MTLTDDNATARLQQLLDRQEVTDLVYRLGACLDDGRFDDMRSLLVDEATVRTPGGAAEGLDALVAQARRNHTPDERVQHIITNLLLDLDGDRGEVRANLVVPFASAADDDQPAPAPPAHLALGEIYRIDVVRTAAGWRLSRIEAVPVWMSGTLDRPTEA
jgi:SnoaL-like domain